MYIQRYFKLIQLMSAVRSIARIISFFSIIVLQGCDHDSTGGPANSITVISSVSPEMPSVIKDSTLGLVHRSAPDRDLVVEDFESGTKRAYVADSVQFKSGFWLLDNALVGTLPGDSKNGKRSVRIKDQGSISMRFDIDSVRSVSLMHGLFGDDASSAWQLWSSVDGGATFQPEDSAVTSISHVFRRASFIVNSLKPVRFEIRKRGKGRIDIDDFEITRISSILARVSNLPQVTGISKPTASVTGSRYNSTSTEDVNLLLGNPSNASVSGSPDNYLVNHTWYEESYNRSKAEPNWVCWHLSAGDLGSTDRLNDFRPDTDLPAGWYEVDNTCYRGSGFDKGHNCPSGDRTISSSANSATFLMDNIIPQAPNNNQRTWEHLESYCRNQVKMGKEAYIIMGSYGTGGTGRFGYATAIDGGKVNVPAHIWKVVVFLKEGGNDLERISADSRVIAIDTPNTEDVDPNFIKYTCTIRDIELRTGYHLLTNVPVLVRQVLLDKKFKGGD